MRGKCHAPATLYPRERPGTHCTGGWVGPKGRSEQVRKISPPPGFDPRTVQPVVSRYTDYATRPIKLYGDTGIRTNVVCFRRVLPSCVTRSVTSEYFGISWILIKVGKGEINLYTEKITDSECSGLSSVDGLVFQNATRISSDAYHVQIMTQAGDIGRP